MKQFQSLTHLGKRGLLLLTTLGSALLLTVLAIPRSGGPIQPAQRDYWPTSGWRVSDPGAEGMNGRPLDDMTAYVGQQMPRIFSVLVVRHGRLVYENYFQGFYPEFRFEVASVTKSITSALVGIALARGDLRDLDQPVLEWFPEFAADQLDSRAGQVTLRHLLTMTSGFDWSEEHGWRWPEEESWVQLALRLPIPVEPGARFTYSTPAAHLLSAALARAAGQSLSEYAGAHLFAPLGIVPGEWLTDPEGYQTGAHGLHLTARDMAKMGYLYLNSGVWDGVQIIPEDWVRESTRRHTDGGFPQETPYGYLWWVTDETGHPAYFAAGYGGQYIYVIPNLDLVVVITSDTEALGLENRALIGRFIVPAVYR